MGIAYVDRELSRVRPIDGTDFLLHMGFGAEYRFSDEISVQSAMRFNVIPGRAGGEKFYYSRSSTTPGTPIARLKRLPTPIARLKRLPGTLKPQAETVAWHPETGCLAPRLPRTSTAPSGGWARRNCERTVSGAQWIASIIRLTVGMEPHPPKNHLLVSYARPQSFIARTPVILARLGYSVLSPDEFERLRSVGCEGPERPDLLLVDEHRLDEAREALSAELPPVILLTGRRGAPEPAPEIVGVVKRPAGLHELYRLLQQVFEQTPRGVPRVTTRIPALCHSDGRAWEGSLLTLSESGGLLRCATNPPLGSLFAMRFELPGTGALELEAEAAYELVPDLGVVFSAIAPTARQAIGEFVEDVLLA